MTNLSVSEIRRVVGAKITVAESIPFVYEIALRPSIIEDSGAPNEKIKGAIVKMFVPAYLHRFKTDGFLIKGNGNLFQEFTSPF